METFLASLKIIFPSLRIEEAQLKQYRQIATELLKNHYTLDHIRLFFIKNAGSLSALSQIVAIHNQLARLDKIPNDQIVQALTAPDAQLISQIKLLPPLLQLHKKLLDLGLHPHDCQRLIHRLPQPQTTKNLVQALDTTITNYPLQHIKNALLLLANLGVQNQTQLISHTSKEPLSATIPNRPALNPPETLPAKSTKVRDVKRQLALSAEDYPSKRPHTDFKAPPHTSVDIDASTIATPCNRYLTQQQDIPATPSRLSNSSPYFKHPTNAYSMLCMTPLSPSHQPSSGLSQALGSFMPQNLSHPEPFPSPNPLSAHTFYTRYP